MQYSSLKEFFAKGMRDLAKGPVALILVEDQIEIGSTLRHHLDVGFNEVIAFIPKSFEVPADVATAIRRVDHDLAAHSDFTTVVNEMIAALPNRWLYYGFNAEYLFFPFCETRSIGEMLAFHADERRDAMLCYVVDLYAEDLAKHPNAVSIENAYLDRSGYYALSRSDENDQIKERQLDFFGGLRWRYEEHVPADRRKIDRIALFKSKPGLKLLKDHTFSDEEYNTFACPWHHNLTASVASFRTAKALKRNPGSTYEIDSFKWRNSVPFEWHSRQFLDLGLMEPGQWF